MISNGKDQSGDFIMGAVVRIVRNVWKAYRHSSLKINGVSLASRLHKGLDILLKSLMKHL